MKLKHKKRLMQKSANVSQLGPKIGKWRHPPLFVRNIGCTKIQEQVIVNALPQSSHANMDKISKAVNSGAYRLKLST
jgi:hypothetical protein